MNARRIYLSFLCVFLIAYLAWTINLVGAGLDGWLTGWGLPTVVLLMLAAAVALPAFESRVDSPKTKALTKDVGLLLQVFIIGGMLGSLAQLLVWRRSYDLKDFFTGLGWPLVFLILLVATLVIVTVVGRVGARKIGLVAATFAFFLASSIFTVYSAIYVVISLSDTTEDCLHHTPDVAARDACILEHGTGADCDLIEDGDIRNQCYLKHGRRTE